MHACSRTCSQPQARPPAAALNTVVKAVCSEYRIHNADVHVRDDCDVDDLVDVIEGSRVYVPAIYVINKIDQVCGV